MPKNLKYVFTNYYSQAQNQHGTVMVYALIVMLFATIMAVSIVSIAQSDFYQGHYDYHNRKAFQLAHGGIEYAHSRLSEDPEAQDWKHILEIEDAGKINIESFSEDGQVKVVSVGVVNQGGRKSEKSLTAIFTVSQDILPENPPEWELETYAYVNSFRTTGNPTWDETIHIGHPFNSAYFSESLWNSMSNRVIAGEDLKSINTLVLADEIVFVSGNADIVSQSISGSGVIVVSGNVIVRGGSSIGEGNEDNILIVVLGEFDSRGGNFISCYLLVQEELSISGGTILQKPSGDSPDRWIDRHNTEQAEVVRDAWYPSD